MVRRAPARICTGKRPRSQTNWNGRGARPDSTLYVFVDGLGGKHPRAINRVIGVPRGPAVVPADLGRQVGHTCNHSYWNERRDNDLEGFQKVLPYALCICPHDQRWPNNGRVWEMMGGHKASRTGIWNGSSGCDHVIDNI